MDCSFVQNPNSYPTYPSVYKIQLDLYKELHTFYSDIVLPNVCMSNVETVLAEYVSSIIEPVGWKAIWRASKRGSGLSVKCDLLVNVINVTQNSLEALVVIEKILSIQSKEEDLEIHKTEVEKWLKEKRIINSPLIELYVINEDDNEEIYLQSAVVIEHVRFFMKYIWRPWDSISNESQLNEIFVENRLEPRLRLYFDMQNNMVNESTIKRIKYILSEGWNIRHQLDDISYKQELNLEDDQDFSLDEVDMSEALRLKIKLEDFDREMKMLEDPYLRMYAFHLKGCLEEEYENFDDDKKNVLHIVSNECKLDSLQQVVKYYSKDSSSNESILKFHTNIAKAITSAKNDHKIAILPGHYVCDMLPWIEYDIQIDGLSKNKEDVLIESSSLVEDVFIHCSSNLILKNLTLKCSSKCQYLLMVHKGLIKLSNCCLDGCKCQKSSIQVLSKAEVKIDNSIIINKPQVQDKTYFLNEQNDGLDIEE